MQRESLILCIGALPPLTLTKNVPQDRSWRQAAKTFRAAVLLVGMVINFCLNPGY